MFMLIDKLTIEMFINLTMKKTSGHTEMSRLQIRTADWQMGTDAKQKVDFTVIMS